MAVFRRGRRRIRHDVLFSGGMLASVLLSCGGPGPVAPPSRAGMPVILITLDTVRADHLGAYGGRNAISPAFDRWAARGILFEQAGTAAPLTLPAHATLLTGVLPPEHGLRVNGHGRLPSTIRTLAETFRDAGYRTGAFVSSTVLAPWHGLDRGFEVYDAEMPAPGERTAAVTVERALAWLRTVQEEPFFVWVHLYDAHAPYRPPEPYRSLFRREPYDGELAFIDAEMGRFLDALPVSPAADRTGPGRADRRGAILCIVGDHGEGLGAHGEREHGLLLYEATLRVPLILAAPGLAPGRVTVPVSTAQVAPTLVELAGLGSRAAAGLPLNPPREDAPVRSAGDGPPSPAPEESPVYSESLLGQADYGWSPLHSLRRGRWKVVRGRYASLYDLNSDPDEHLDLLDTEPHESGAVARAPVLLAELDRLLAARGPGGDTRLERPRDGAPDDLRSLGYLGGSPAGDPAGGPDPRRRVAFHDSVVGALADYRDGRFDRATKRLQELLAGEPGNPFLLDLSGSVQMARNHPAAAVAHFREALARGGSRLPLQARLAEALLEAGQPAEAEAEARAGLEAAPGPPDGRTVVILCRALLARGRPADAASTARRLAARLAKEDPYREDINRLATGQAADVPAPPSSVGPLRW